MKEEGKRELKVSRDEKYSGQACLLKEIFETDMEGYQGSKAFKW